MTQKLIFIPLFLQVLLTFLVGFRLLGLRLAEIRRRRIPPEQLRTRVQAAAQFKDSHPASDNFQNLFEFPVLFYVLVIVTYLTASASWLMFVLLCLFVLCRAAHSAIHLGPNNPIHRFIAFAASSLFLLVGWGVLSVRLFL
jgi:hypothetical protein